MIKPTPKAQTLPDDLKSYWEDAMAEKFPMTIEEACAYIQSHYWNCYPSIQADKISCNVQIVTDIPEGVMPPPGASMQGKNYNTRTTSYVSYDYVYITEFKKSTIDEQLKDYKK